MKPFTQFAKFMTPRSRAQTNRRSKRSHIGKIYQIIIFDSSVIKTESMIIIFMKPSKLYLYGKDY